ncbi:hypothetical protein PLCT2_00220 [Planctomycetaceae bacterium]|nr:hypothetical protein PLCT2_00220 [Planctomycetaceae bacterium]
MGMLRTIGTLLMFAGLGGMGWGAWDYFTERESLEIGGTRLVVEDRKMPVQALVGLGLFALGSGAMLVGMRSRR